MKTENLARVAAFRALHAPGELLVLANAWDAGSAALFEACGARAIATTSAAVSWSHGYPDGEKLPRNRLLQTVSDILRVVKIPVSADIEGGFSRDPNEVSSFVLELVELGVVGINLEDGTDPPDLLAAKIAAVKAAATRAGRDVFVNARTDVFLHKLVSPEQAMREVLARVEPYVRAGADGIFVPLLAEPEEIRKITAAVDLPVNLLGFPALPPAAALRALGVRRLSAGSGIARVALASAQASVERFLVDGDSTRLLTAPARLENMNALLKRP